MKALIAMSGGVDSSVAAWLTQQQGFACTGATMRLYDKPGSSDASDAKAVADRLGMPFHIFDFTQAFQEKVICHFVTCYEQGLTPNPCIQCNRHLKFDALLQPALELGCDCIVTGHYAQVRFDSGSGRYLLKKAVDTPKDQTYFLYTLTQQQLSHTRFPLGELTKEQVRQIAREQGFVNARKRDSQDICFIPGGDYLAFLEQFNGRAYPNGDFLDLQGNVVGRHNGAAGYTCGQRKGLGIALGQPVYVCSKDMTANTVTVGPNEALFHRALLACDWNWISIAPPEAPIKVMAKARSRMNEQPAWIYPEENGTFRVEFDQAQRALTPGQAVVAYDGDTVIGGGTIQKIL